ncbi:31926_t:CDS:2, partial [Racocetra persica]
LDVEEPDRAVVKVVEDCSCFITNTGNNKIRSISFAVLASKKLSYFDK